ncbi:MAG: response regulator transcription factor [Saprospiraceae bacterium]|nr:response regulator transcription factor [Saprospiraceae bacterium]
MIRIAIADDEALFRKGILMLLEDEADFEIVFEAEDGQHLLEQLKAQDPLPDILLLDLNMPRLSGIEAAKTIREQFPELKFIVLSTFFSKAFIINMIEIGAASYLAKNATPEEMKATIREVHEKGFSYNRQVLEVIRENMLDKTKPKITSPFGVELTDREKEILQLICEEYTTHEIAANLYISPRTVDGHRNNLLQKLGCKNVAGLVVFAIRNDLVTVNPETLWFKK